MPSYSVTIDHTVKNDKVAAWKDEFNSATRKAFREANGFSSAITAEADAPGGINKTITVTHMINDLDKAWAHYTRHHADGNANSMRNIRGANNGHDWKNKIVWP